MVLQIGTYALQILFHLDTQRLQMIAWAYAAQHKQLRRLKCASTKQDFGLGMNLQRLLSATVFHTCDAPVRPQQFSGMGARDNSQIGALAHDGV